MVQKRLQPRHAVSYISIAGGAGWSRYAALFMQMPFLVLMIYLATESRLGNTLLGMELCLVKELYYTFSIQ